jgi:hypothetical protein
VARCWRGVEAAALDDVVVGLAGSCRSQQIQHVGPTADWRGEGEAESGAQHRRALTCQPGLGIHAGAGCVVVMGLQTERPCLCLCRGDAYARSLPCRCLAQSHHRTKPGTRTAPAHSKSRTRGPGRHPSRCPRDALHLGYHTPSAAIGGATSKSGSTQHTQTPLKRGAEEPSLIICIVPQPAFCHVQRAPSPSLIHA